MANLKISDFGFYWITKNDGTELVLRIDSRISRLTKCGSVKKISAIEDELFGNSVTVLVDWDNGESDYLDVEELFDISEITAENALRKTFCFSSANL